MRKLLYIVLISAFIMFVVACGTSEENSESNNASGSNDEATEEAFVTVEHELDTTEVEKNPEKVVVFDFGSLDTLDQLGVQITGVPQQSVPSYLEEYES